MEISESKYEFPLDRLPALVIVNIARYLSNKDVAACCAVSRGVREAFDDELVWKPRYDSDRAEYLLQTPCKVQPGFVSPESQNSSLSPVSKWRVAFMAENHLWNNWRKGKYRQEAIIIEKKQLLRVDRNRSLYHEFLSNDYVIAGFSGRIKILDVRDYPATIAIEPIPTPEYLQKAFTRNDYLLFLYSSAVQVFQLNFLTKQWNVKHAFILDEPEKLCNEKKHQFYDYVYKTKRSITYEVVQPYFVGCLEGDSTMHIWNFETGVKLKTQKCPVKNVTIQAINSSNLNLIITVKEKESNSSLFLVYDLLKSVFLPFSETVHGSYKHCVFGDCLSIWADGNLNIYNYQNCKKLLSNYFLDTYELKTVGNDIVFLQGDVLKLFNLATGKIEILVVGVRWFEVLSNKFIQVEFVRCKSLIIYEVGSSRNLRKTKLIFPFRSCGYYLNKCATRYIVRYSDGHVIHLW